MDSFRYKAITETGKVLDQRILAKNKEEVVELLRGRKLKIISIKKVPKDIQVFKKKISVFDKANFCRYLAVMIRSGLSVSDALEIIYAETENPSLKEILHELTFDIQKGGEISTTLKRYPQVFDKVFLALIQAGEQSGSLEKTFEYLANQLYAVHRLNKKIQGAMMYPAVIFIAMFGVGVLMMTFVLPRLGSVFLKMKIPLPTPTRILLETGKYIGDHTLLVLAGIGVLCGSVYFLFAYYRTRKFLMSHIVNLPIMKNMFKKMDLARFSRTLSTLLKSGVPIMQALQIASETFSQFDMQRMAKEFSKGIQEGKPLASLLTSDRKVFPAMMIQTIQTGEKTGTLDEVLVEIADFYEAELEDALKEFTTILEPIIMLVIGVAVGAMVVMIIAPIYSVLGGLQNTTGK